MKAGQVLYHRTVLHLLAVAFFTFPVAQQSQPTQTLPPLQSAEALGQHLFVRSGSTGMVLVVVRDKETAIQTFGETAPNSHQRPTPDSFLRLCSLTKIFATDLLVKLDQSKLLRLDTPLQTLAPVHGHVPVPLHDPDRPITLGDLATHTSGLPRELGPAPRDTPHFTYPGPQTRWTWLRTHRPRTTPGTAALYSNLGFDFLGDALEQVAHTPYPQLLATRTTTPLGMAETTFTPTSGQCARLLISAHDEGPCTSTVNSAGSSGLYSTANDMARFLHYLLGTGTTPNPAQAFPRQDGAAQAVYVNPATLKSVHGIYLAGDPTGIGLGWIHISGTETPALDPSDPRAPGRSNIDIIEKTGGGAGFLTYIAMLPAQHIAIFLAATDGTIETHLNFFRNANNVLLTLAGLPTLSIPDTKPAPKPRRKPTPKHSPSRR
jgi:D-alanyl-D-alanine-carboxypeptidase/D-alanyl-D-alanine-endopeptidase